MPTYLLRWYIIDENVGIGFRTIERSCIPDNVPTPHAPRSPDLARVQLLRAHRHFQHIQSYRFRLEGKLDLVYPIIAVKGDRLTTWKGSNGKRDPREGYRVSVLRELELDSLGLGCHRDLAPFLRFEAKCDGSDVLLRLRKEGDAHGGCWRAERWMLACGKLGFA